MSDLGKAYVQIVPKATGITEKIKGQVSPGAGKAGKDAGSSFAGSFKKIIAGAAIGGTVVAGLKAALDEGAKLQQSYGGLDTLYGDAANAAKKYAAQAASAGISANNYAEQAVSFGASLKAAFSGDTAKAAEAANTAILDMADNAAKMGTPLESIQNAYQGFAKQNYTMLDNLKLGYGGTKQEMERLLADATKISGVQYNMDNLGDVYSAIHVIQGELGLTGVAAMEASTTFSGSFGAMKAAAQNLLGNLALGEDVAPAMEQLATSAGTFFFNNLIPMVGNVISQLPTAITAFVQAGAPMLIESGRGLIDSLGSGFTGAVPTFMENVPTLLNDIGTTISNNVPVLMEQGGQMLSAMLDGFYEQIPLMLEGAGELLTQIGVYLEENLPVFAEKGGEILQGLAESFVTNLPSMLTALAKFSWQVLQFLSRMVGSMMTAGAKLIIGLVKGLGGGAVGLVRSAMNKIKDAMEEPIENAKETLSGIIEKIKGFFPLNIGKIFSGLQLPHITVSGGSPPFGIAGRGSLPSFDVQWYKKAEDQPYMFDSATIFGAGEANDEMLYGRSNLMRDIKEAAGGGGTTNTFYITVNGAENPEEWARRFAKEFQLVARTA